MKGCGLSSLLMSATDLVQSTCLISRFQRISMFMKTRCNAFGISAKLAK
jgi:hypothetical protein